MQEAAYSYNDRELGVTVRGEDFAEFATNLSRIYGDAQTNALLASWSGESADPGMTAALQQLVGAFPGSVPIPGTISVPPPALPPYPQGGQYQQPQAPAGVQQRAPSQCPQCGIGQVVLRKRSDGSGQFMGCNNFPACRYIQRG